LNVSVKITIIMSKKTKLQLASIDMDTGEVQPGVVAFVAKRHYFNENHVTMFQNALESISKSDLGGTDAKVFMYLLAKAGMGNKIFISFKEAAVDLGLQKPHFSRSIKNLCERNIIIKGEEKIGRTNSLRINYAVAWKGKIKDHKTIRMYDSHRPIFDKKEDIPKTKTLFDPQF